MSAHTTVVTFMHYFTAWYDHLVLIMGCDFVAAAARTSGRKPVVPEESEDEEEETYVVICRAVVTQALD